jgi:hypothetical protein
MDSGGFGSDVNFGLSILFLAALVLLVWGFQQRQVYEKRSEGGLKLVIGGSLMGIFALAVVMSMVIASLSDSDDRVSDLSIDASSEADVVWDGAQRYLRGVDQVRVTGEADSNRFDITFVGTDDAVGTMTSSGVRIRFIHVDDESYIKPSDEFWKANPDAEAIIDFVDGRWIRVDKRDSRFAGLRSVIDRAQFFEPLGAAGELGRSRSRTIHGVDCIAVRSGAGVLYLAQDPSRLMRIDAGRSLVADIDYDAQTVTPRTPSAVVDGSEVFASGTNT